MIAQLLEGLRTAVDRAATSVELQRHLYGVAAIMETTSATRSNNYSPCWKASSSTCL